MQTFDSTLTYLLLDAYSLYFLKANGKSKRRIAVIDRYQIVYEGQPGFKLRSKLHSIVKTVYLLL